MILHESHEDCLSRDGIMSLHSDGPNPIFPMLEGKFLSRPDDFTLQAQTSPL